MITDANDYFSKGCGRCARFATADCSAMIWREGLARLRQICLGSGLQEVVKWGQPAYMHAGRNIALLGTFRNDFRLIFMNASLLLDDGNLLQLQGENGQTANMLRFTSVAEVEAAASIIPAFLQQLMEHAELGTKPQKVSQLIAMPDELAEALGTDPQLAAAFSALTPGRQKSYLIAIG